jgi:hypothetical protein
MRSPILTCALYRRAPSSKKPKGGLSFGVITYPIYKTIGGDDTGRIDCAVRAVAILLPVGMATGSMGSIVPVVGWSVTEAICDQALLARAIATEVLGRVVPTVRKIVPDAIAKRRSRHPVLYCHEDESQATVCSSHGGICHQTVRLR